MPERPREFTPPPASIQPDVDAEPASPLAPRALFGAAPGFGSPPRLKRKASTKPCCPVDDGNQDGNRAKARRLKLFGEQAGCKDNLGEASRRPRRDDDNDDGSSRDLAAPAPAAPRALFV